MAKISILIPCFNEEENVIPLSKAIIKEFEQSLNQYNYEIVFIDNDSQDTTREKLRALCAGNHKIKAIFNTKNFGQNNSPIYGMTQTTGDCTIVMCADFQGISLRLYPSSATIPRKKGLGSFKLRNISMKFLSYKPNPVKCSICSTSDNFLIVL